jgi:hypothetical protein
MYLLTSYVNSALCYSNILCCVFIILSITETKRQKAVLTQGATMRFIQKNRTENLGVCTASARNLNKSDKPDQRLTGSRDKTKDSLLQRYLFRALKPVVHIAVRSPPMNLKQVRFLCLNITYMLSHLNHFT